VQSKVQCNFFIVTAVAIGNINYRNQQNHFWQIKARTSIDKKISVTQLYYACGTNTCNVVKKKSSGCFCKEPNRRGFASKCSHAHALSFPRSVLTLTHLAVNSTKTGFYSMPFIGNMFAPIINSAGVLPSRSNPNLYILILKLPFIINPLGLFVRNFNLSKCVRSLHVSHFGTRRFCDNAGIMFERKQGIWLIPAYRGRTIVFVLSLFPLRLIFFNNVLVTEWKRVVKQRAQLNLLTLISVI